MSYSECVQTNQTPGATTEFMIQNPAPAVMFIRTTEGHVISVQVVSFAEVSITKALAGTPLSEHTNIWFDLSSETTLQVQ